jgi:hypothetical protein
MSYQAIDWKDGNLEHEPLLLLPLMYIMQEMWFETFLLLGDYYSSPDSVNFLLLEAYYVSPWKLQVKKHFLELPEPLHLSLNFL